MQEITTGQITNAARKPELGKISEFSRQSENKYTAEISQSLIFNFKSQ